MPTARTSTTHLLLLYVCSLAPSRSRTLLSILPYIVYSKHQQTKLAATYRTITVVAVVAKYVRYDVFLVRSHAQRYIEYLLVYHYMQQHCGNTLFIAVKIYSYPGIYMVICTWGQTQNAHWRTTRYTPQHNAITQESVSCANKRTITAATIRKNRSVVPRLYISYCRCCRCIYAGYEW